MKVAIVGEGLAGIACAHELIRHGIMPTIFEKKSYSGEILDFPAILLDIFNVPIKDPIKHLDKHYGIKITPHYDLTEIVMVSPSKIYTVKGNMGKILLRGREKDAVANQIYYKLNPPVIFNTNVNIQDIKNEYDHVVVATSMTDLAQQMNLMTIHFDAWVRIADIIGDFKTGSVKVWLNTKYAKHGYAYLVPSSSTKANIILIVDNITPDQLDYYWNEFLTSENITYLVHRIKDLRHTVGTVYPVNIGNLYFAGHCGGFIDSLLGFGSMKALLTGALAGKCIAEGLDYNIETQDFVKDIKKKYEFRKVFNTFDNDAIDLFVAIENFPIVKQFIFNNPFLKITHGTFLAKAYNAIAKSKQD